MIFSSPSCAKFLFANRQYKRRLADLKPKIALSFRFQVSRAVLSRCCEPTLLQNQSNLIKTWVEIMLLTPPLSPEVGTSARACHRGVRQQWRNACAVGSLRLDRFWVDHAVKSSGERSNWGMSPAGARVEPSQRGREFGNQVSESSFTEGAPDCMQPTKETWSSVGFVTPPFGWSITRYARSLITSVVFLHRHEHELVMRRSTRFH